MTLYTVRTSLKLKRKKKENDFKKFFYDISYIIAIFSSKRL